MPDKSVPRKTVSVTFTTTVDHLPLTCYECRFADCCDGRVGKLTKKAGTEWTKLAMTKRHPHCPMVIVES